MNILKGEIYQNFQQNIKNDHNEYFLNDYLEH